MEDLEKMKSFPTLEPKKGEEMLAFVFGLGWMHESNSLKSTDPAIWAFQDLHQRNWGK